MKNRILSFITITIIFTGLYSSKSLSQVNSNFEALTGTYRISENSSSGISNNPQLFAWQSVQTPINTQIMGIMFIDSLHGWLSHNNNGAMRTVNGGMSWDTSSFNDTNFSGGYNSIYFANNQTGWATGSAIQIRKTTNGGLNWFKQYGPPVAGIAHSIYFFDANTGFIYGSKNYPYVPFAAKTINGGTNWTEVNASFSGAQELNKQFWVNSTTGWIAGYDVLLKTTDGGTTYANMFSSVPPTSNSHNDLLCIYFANVLTGWIGGSNLDKKNIYVTTNGGTNWIFQTNPVSVNNAYVQINDMQMLNSDSGWAIHGTPFSGAIMFTSNGGANWVTEEGSNNWFNCAAYYQRSRAWCGASGGNVWYTNLSQPLGIETISTEVPKQFGLFQNYPNPFNPSTVIRFQLAGKHSNAQSVNLTVYDAIGREADVLVNETLRSGSYEFTWNASAVPSGVYFCRLTAGEFSSVKRMVLLK